MERTSIFDFSGEQGAEEQVGPAVSALLAESGLLLPDFFRAQLEESILRAVVEASAGQRGPALPARVCIHFNDAAAQNASARWGFFLVQKHGSVEDAQRLFLDMHLYQE